jgi:hypothetical protein
VPAAGIATEHTSALHVFALKITSHLASSDAGRSCLAASGLIQKLLSRAHTLQRPACQLALLVVLSCVYDFSSGERKYWAEIYNDGGQEWVAASLPPSREPRPERMLPEVLRQASAALHGGGEWRARCSRAEQAVRQSGSQAVRQSGSQAVRQSGSQAVRQSRSHAVRQSRSHAEQCLGVICSDSAATRSCDKGRDHMPGHEAQPNNG